MILDACVLLALLDRDDLRHQPATDVILDHAGEPFTTPTAEAVVGEHRARVG